jgi:hypothetical protein
MIKSSSYLVYLDVSSLAWTGHLVHVAIPESRGIHVGWDNFFTLVTTSSKG